MANDMILGGSGALALPDYLQGVNLGVSEGLLATIGVGGNRIGLKGNRFRQIINGKEEGVWDENYLDVIVLGAVPAISRIFYEGTYDPDTKAAPTCYSADGVAPPDDVKQKQSTKCEICPQNQKGSKIVNGQKIKACSYFQRLIVMLAGDMEGLAYQLDIKSMGIFGESHAAQNKYNIRDYTKLISNRGVDIAQIVTRLSFDTDQSVPKLLFAASRFVSAEELAVVQTKVGSEEVNRMLKINMSTLDISGEVDATAVPATEAPAKVVETAMAAAREAVKEDAAAPAATQAALVMTEKAGGLTYDAFVKEGWSDEDMVAEGYATRPAPPKPTAPPKPAVPSKPPAASTAPQVPVKRGPGRPPAAKPQTAPPTVQKAAPTPQKPSAPPTVTKAHPVPEAAPEAVQETSSDAEVLDILASLT